MNSSETRAVGGRLMTGMLALLAVILTAGDAVAAQPSVVVAAAAGKPKWLVELVPIIILIAVAVLVVARLPRPDVQHSDAYRRRRIMNWLPLGLTYAFLYMGRYNLSEFKTAQFLTNEQYGDIFGLGAMVYGLSFILNGPLADRWGGRATILIAAAGSGIANLLMGLATATDTYIAGDKVLTLSILYSANMYFQSFGAVSIVKVNASWFHIRERGVFAGIFGILISLGIYFAYDWSRIILTTWTDMPELVFYVPAALLFLFFLIDLPLVKNHPSDAGHSDFDAGDASSGDDGVRQPAVVVLMRMLRNPVIMIIACIELCSGFLRNAIMHWGRDFAKAVSIGEQLVFQHWGMMLCIAGITGGMFSGIISDRIFQSRRGPVAAVLYAIMVAGALAILPMLAMNTAMAVGWVVIVMSMAIIGVHGMLSGVASQDFGGKKNAGVAVGLIDGFVYAGTALQAVVLGRLLPEKGSPAAAQIDSWTVWPIAMLPAAALGLGLAVLVWHARPKPAHVTVAETLVDTAPAEKPPAT